jgi:hypothetical protein
MREIKATIEGLTPLLMHNIAGMQQTSGGTKKSIPTPENEALAGCYWTDDEHSSLAIPARCLHASFLKTAPKYRIPKSSLTSLVSSAMHVGPEMIPLQKKDYEVDVQSVVVQKARIFRARAKVFPWSATFTLFFDEEWIGLDVMQITIPQLIKTAGKLVGVLDYRPDKKGQFGTFRLVRYELLPATKAVAVVEAEIIGFPNQTKTKRKVA